MKTILVLFFLVVPTLSFASLYSCSGGGLSIDLAENPVEMKIKGNGINAMAQDVRMLSTFETVVSGNVFKPAVTIKLTIKDSHSGDPGDRFYANLQLSSAAGVKNYARIVCVRGNE